MMTRCGTSRKSLTNTTLTTGLHAGRCWSRWKRHTGNWMPILPDDGQSPMRTCFSASPQHRKRYRHKGGIRKQCKRGPYAQAWRQKDRVSDGKGQEKGNLFRKTKLKKDKKMNIKLTKTERLLLCGGLIGAGIADAASLRDGNERKRGCAREDLRQLGKRGGQA